MERFIIIKGRAYVQLRRIGSDKVIEYAMDGDRPSYIDIPVLHTHNVANVGRGELQMLFWTNEPFDPSDPDTYNEKVTTETILRPEERCLEASR
jgi:UDP-2-acetamido-2,6-beta-L-arabino-hexul-4-ose reductase